MRAEEKTFDRCAEVAGVQHIVSLASMSAPSWPSTWVLRLHTRFLNPQKRRYFVVGDRNFQAFLSGNVFSKIAPISPREKTKTLRDPWLLHVALT
jgi:hypothetical protein